MTLGAASRTISSQFSSPHIPPYPVPEYPISINNLQYNPLPPNYCRPIEFRYLQVILIEFSFFPISLMPSSSKPKKYCCAWEGCDKSFTRSDHLQRHILNHSTGGSTCPRCSLHFKRPDLLGKIHTCPFGLGRDYSSASGGGPDTIPDRHMARHRQRDAEAGGEGLGVIESRKKLWRDSDGSIVSKRPAHADGPGPLPKKKALEQHNQDELTASNMYNFQTLHTEPLSPPKSMLSADSMDAPPSLMEFYPDRVFAEPTNGSDMFDFLANSSWGSNPQSSSMYAGGVMPSEDMFNPDTGNISQWVQFIRMLTNFRQPVLLICLSRP